MKALLIAVVPVVLALGCSKAEPAAPPVASVSAAPPVASQTVVAPDPAVAAAADPAAAVATAVPVAAAAAPAAVAKAVPTEADYEVQAQSAITPANAAQVLAAIDKQVGH